MDSLPKSDLLGLALSDLYEKKNLDQSFYLNVNHSWRDTMPLDIFFRTEEELSELDTYALEFCTGKILDAGAGAGSISLILQNRGFDVTALDSSPRICRIMKERGLDRVVQKDVFEFSGEKYDTILMLMNGIGLAGEMKRFRDLMAHLKTILKQGGQLLFDSSDLSYLYKDQAKPEKSIFWRNSIPI